MNNRFIVDKEEYARVARQAAADGAVLIKNDKGVLPLEKGCRVSVWGRSAFNYYKSGTGSGGLVNTEYVVSILQALQQEEGLIVDNELLGIYEEWLQDNPFDVGKGWAQEPFSQKEMPVSLEMVKAARERSEVAIVIIGRSAGEDRDTQYIPGSFLLDELEEDMLKKVTSVFDKVVVLLNVGNIIDMNWLDSIEVSSVMYVWQGGQEGGNAVADVLMGRVNPSGRLTDTIAFDISDYPSDRYFGTDVDTIYGEDIYVGYRYFETFAKDRVRFPFGYGLSYTEFSISEMSMVCVNNSIHVALLVRNEGELPGRTPVMFFVSAPQGKLGKAARSMVAFRKTKVLRAGEAQSISVEIDAGSLASYDDSGVTGYRFSYVLEAGRYDIYAGFNVAEAQLAGSFELGEDEVVDRVKSVLAPTAEFDRMHAAMSSNGEILCQWEKAPLRTYDPEQRKHSGSKPKCTYTGDRGYHLCDVYDGKVSLEDFVAQLSDTDLRCIVRGEGMNSARVTPGTAAAFGGVSDGLVHFGIPAACCTDGPSGLRLDSGAKAFSLPNGTCLACTFDEEINEELFTFVGTEMRKNHIECLLGPGMNIHRHPLNGRNFEYFSEDPLLTGKIAAAQLKGMHKMDVTGTIKHFAANNQEHRRRDLNSVVSERALREIYLKGFEIAVKEAKARSIMTTYGAINGIWTAGSYDLNTTLLRKEWGFKGIVMTDWWAYVNSEGGAPSIDNLAQMVAAGNDVYMVIANSMENESKDNLKSWMEEGKLTRSRLAGCAMHILELIMRLPVMERFLNRISEEEREAYSQLSAVDKEILGLTYLKAVDGVLEIDGAGISTNAGENYLFGVDVPNQVDLQMDITLSVTAMEVAQVPISIYVDGALRSSHTLRNTNGEDIVLTEKLGPFLNRHNYINLFFGQGGIMIKKIRIYTV